jgi:hypothetical protein
MLTFFTILNFSALALHLVWHAIDDRLYKRQQKMAAGAMLEALVKMQEGNPDDEE